MSLLVRALRRFCTQVNPYGWFELDMDSHRALVAAAATLTGLRTPPEAETIRSAADGSEFPLDLLADEE